MSTASPLLTVGLETSGPVGSVALLRDGQTLEERTLGETGRRHARTLVAELDLLLKSSRVKPRDVGLVAVSIGPGSFTGLRVGVVAAKTWAYVTGCRLLGVPTFDAISSQISAGGASAWVIEDALRGELFVQRYASEEDGWRAASDVRIQSFDDWKIGIGPGEIVTGPGLQKYAGDLEAVHCQVAPMEGWRPTAASVARCALSLAASGRSDDPIQLAPLYIRRSAAEEKLDGLAAHGSGN